VSYNASPRARTAPSSTYRLQLSPGFGFSDLAEQADYLAALGVSHAYLSPILQAAPGSTHGYDVVDHGRLSAELGGAEGFSRLSAALSAAGLGAVVDIVPNHMAIPVPEHGNAAWWSVLRDGPASAYAHWFDIDWAAQGGRVLMAVLGRPLAEVLAAGELVLDRSGGPSGAPVLRYFDHVFPVRAGTAELPLAELVDQQWYRLAYWRVGDEEVNYRRFFDVKTLAGLRVEAPDVFAATHELIAALVRGGTVHGLRVDHPDGLADPREYLRRLAVAAPGAWVVVEKILEGDERLPADWPCAGTTGYDTLHPVAGLFADPAGDAPLTAAYIELTGQPADFAAVVTTAKHDIIERVLATEVDRLTELAAAACRAEPARRDHTKQGLRAAIVEMLAAFSVYRAYVVPGEPAPPAAVREVDHAAATAKTRLPPARHATVDLVRDLVLGHTGDKAGDRAGDRAGEAAHGLGGPRAEFVVRFQQTCGPVMAKGVEDTAFYRWNRLVALNEVGGDPTRLGVSPAQFHAHAARLQRDWPATMTTLTTHDTKRSEDLRARLLVLSQIPRRWAETVRAWHDQAARHRSPAGWPDPNTEYLLWQTLLGAWPIDADRLTRYLEKATREAKQHTSWTDPNIEHDTAVREFARAVLADPDITSSVASLADWLAPHARASVLGQKLVQLTMPGVPDSYQGTELVTLTLVDPDNRQAVDWAARRELLARLDSGEKPATLDAEKLLVTSRALRLRRDHPDWFGPTATYTPVPTSTEHLLAFARSAKAVTVVSRLTVALDQAGGWGNATITLPDGHWYDLLTGATHRAGPVAATDLLPTLPVALLTHQPADRDAASTDYQT
jgi:(1->4)-alpha-D-glucan 1-alpha-D-glucosylmutase